MRWGRGWQDSANFDAGNVILLKTKVFDRSMKETTLARYLIKMLVLVLRDSLCIFFLTKPPSAIIYLFEVNVIHVVLVFLLLTLNIFHTLF